MNSKTKEAVKDYNKDYYAKNKKVILEKLLTKVECPLCKRQVNHQNLFKHQKTNLCKSRQDKPDNINELKLMIEGLTKKIDDLTNNKTEKKNDE